MMPTFPRSPLSFRTAGFLKSGPKRLRNGVPLWTETACRFPPKPPAGLNRNRLSETPKFALVAVEEAFKNLKGDLAIRPIFHQLEGAHRGPRLHCLLGVLP